MLDCKKLEPFVTPYVDGELDGAARVDVDRHLQACPPCHSRVAAERAVRELVQERKSTLTKECAPPALRARCALARLKARATLDDDVARGFSRAAGGGFSRARWFQRSRPFALAAGLVIIVGGAFVYELTDRSARVMAAELVADHVKCFGVNTLLNIQQQQASLVEGSMASAFGWRVHLPAWPQRAGLELVGARPCLYGEGRVAHIMYRHRGRPVSVFMLPERVRPSEVVEVMGHEAAIWSEGDRTFVLIAKEPRQDVERMASFVHAELH
jgi:anti-sigma factor RsiW